MRLLACFAVLLLLPPLRSLAAEGDDPGVLITEEAHGNEVQLMIKAIYCTDVTLTLNAELRNMESSLPLPFTVEIHGAERTELVTFRFSDTSGLGQYKFHYTWLPGGRDGKPDGTVYALPYDRSFPRRLIQGYRGDYSHQQGSANEYALDWAMPEGTPVRAARGGTVVGVRQDSTKGGPSKEFGRSSNYVIIRHSDGTYGEYLHLQPGGVRVRIGTRVETGAVIALSGNTGMSSQPHLHFAVFRTLDGNGRETLPIQFQLSTGSAETLQQGRVY